MIDLTAKIDNDEALRKLRQLQQVAKQTTSSVVTDADRMDMAMARLGRTLGQLGVGISLAGLVRQVGQVRGEFQKLEIAFSTMLQSEAKATALMAQLTRTAATTPFGLQDVANGAKQLLAYGTSAEKVNETLIRLGDIAAGLSIPLGDLVYLYGTTQTQGRLFTQDLRQFQGRGIPLAEELAKQFKVSTSEVGKLVTAGKVGFPEVEKAIISMTSAGSKFGGLMEKQSKTITGLISNLEDAFDTMFNEIGKSTEGVFVESIETAIMLVENYKKVLDVLIPIVATYGTYKAALIAVAAAQKAMLAIDASKTFLSMARSIGVANAAMKSLNLTMAASPWALLAALVVGAGVAIYKFAKNSKGAEKAVAELHEGVGKEVTALDEAFGALENAKKGTNEYKDAIVEINSKYGSYFENQLTEKSNADEIAKAYDRVKNAIIGASLERAKSAYLEEPTEDLAKSESKVIRRLGDSGLVNQMNDFARGVWSRNVEKLIADVKSSGGEMSLEETKKQLTDILRSARELSGLSFTGENEKYYNIGLSGVPLERLLEDAKAMAQAEKAFKEFSSGYTAEDNKVVTEDPKKELSDEEKKRLKMIKELNVKLEKEASQAQINAMKEGTAKKLAQIDFEYNQREAEIKKREEELKTLQGGKLTEGQTATFGAMRTGNAYQRKAERMDALYTPMDIDVASLWEDEQQAMRDYLKEFGTYQEKLQAMVEEYDLQMQSATTEGQKAAIQAERDAALAEMEVKASEWAQQLVDLTISQLNKTISDVEAQLDLAQSEYDALGSSDSDEGKKLRAQINNLKAKIKVLLSQREATDAKNEIDAAPSKNALEDWQKMYETLDRVADGFKQLGDEIGGTVGKIIGGAGDVATSTLSMINGITTLANWSVRSTELTAQGASKAMIAVEKASVILTIIQTAISVVQTLMSLFAKGADYSDYNALKDKYDKLNEVWDELIEKKDRYIKMSYGEEARKVGEEAIDLVERQIDAYKELGVARLNAGASAGSHSIGRRIQDSMSDEGWAQLRSAASELGFDYNKVAGGRMEGLFGLSVEQLEELKWKAPSFWAQLDSEVQDYLNKIIEGQAQIEELQNASKEQLTQVSFDSVFDSFIETLMDMDASAEEFSKNFSEYMMRAILTTQIGEAYKERLQKWYDDFAKANDDSDVTTDEINRLRSEWDAMVQEALALRDGIADITGYGDEMAQGQEATAKGFQTMDQETGSELNGRFTDMQGKMAEQLGLSREALERIEYIRNLTEQQLHAQIDTRDILINIAGNVSEIRAFTESIPMIHEAVTKTNKILDEKL